MSATQSGTIVFPIFTGGPNGITDSAVSVGITARTGARKWTAFSAFAGVMSSLVTSFRRSARPCRMPCGPTRFGPEPHLHEPHDPALGEDDDEPHDRRNEGDEQDDLEVGPEEGVEALHRSTSPSTMSMVPIRATRSETRCPFASRGRAWRLMKEGGRTCMRYGLFEPLETQ